MKSYLRDFAFLFSHLLDTKYLKYYLIIIFATSFLVLSGFDWGYLIFMHKHVPQMFLFLFDVFGFIFPISLLIGTFIYYHKKKNIFAEKLFKVSFYSIGLAYLSSTFIKIFTGRISPPFRGDYIQWVDNSHSFQFGFMREQIIGGFPSSHATIFFALAFSFYFVFPKNWKLQFLSFLVASLVSFGVSLGFHWFSEIFAGMILGFVVGKIVSTYLKQLNNKVV